MGVVGSHGFSSSANGVGGSILGILPSSAAIGNRSAVPGLGVSPMLGNSGPQITSSMGNIVGGGNIGSSMSSGGGLSVPGLASRLNLAANSGSGKLSVQVPNRLMSDVLQQAAPILLDDIKDNWALEVFRKQQVEFLIATDVAARGLDIIGVKMVINFACPRDLTSYVHRVGRTARAGRDGYAVTFVTDNDRSLLKAIAKGAGSKLKSRIVAEQSITKWSQIIDQMEDQLAAVLQEEVYGLIEEKLFQDFLPTERRILDLATIGLVEDLLTIFGLKYRCMIL